MRKTNVKLFALITLAVALSACGGGQSSPPEAVSVTLTPNTASVYLTQSVQFTATVHNSTNSAVTWSLSGAGCSGATCGTISSAGLYTAPANVPSPATVTVKATAAADTSKSASATITILEGVNEWIWVSGSNTVSQVGVYGTQGTPNPSNVPGARGGAVSWIDSSGNLWLFGGWGYGSNAIEFALNDLWNYDLTTHEWTWASGSDMTYQAGVYGTKGIADPSNVPGARDAAVSWSNSSSNVWLFGGWGVDSNLGYGQLNDLWKLDLTTLEWTWVSGSNTEGQVGIYGTKGIGDPSNVPGARGGAVSWIDSSGNLWLFGGWGTDMPGGEFWLNDLWKFDPITLEWTWVSGSNIRNQPSVYGTQGTAAPTNVPGARAYAISWTDSSGKLWLFGGGGPTGDLNDLWEFDATTLEWTWVSGSNTFNQASVYGTQGIAASSNVPGARSGAVSWIDSSGKLWLFGGRQPGLSYPYEWLNDLWKFDPATLEWTWVSGSNSVDQGGIYGTKGIADPSNVPGARSGAVSWIDSSGKLWLFGGNGNDSAGTQNLLNDLWQYIR
jgi:N-acetylneuraminic acid mutarotase